MRCNTARTLGALEPKTTMPAPIKPTRAHLFARPRLEELMQHGELANDLQVQALLVGIRYDDGHETPDALLVVNWRSVSAPERSYRQMHHFSAALHEDPVRHARRLMHDLIKQGPVTDDHERHERPSRASKRRARTTA